MADPQTPENPNPNSNSDHPPSPASNPIPNSSPPPDESPIAATNPGKRTREEDETDAGASTEEPAAKRRVKTTAASEVMYRIVVPSREIGKVIGRAGHRIQKIREDTKATVKIADAISRHEERVIIISSKDSDSEYSDAENALQQIVSLVLMDDKGNAGAAKVGAGHVAENTVRLLIAGSQAGGLIGVSGQNIETLRNSSGASITVLAPSQLPPCASVHESDRVVQLSGDVPAVLRAVIEIGCQLRGNPPKQVIAVNPTNKQSHRQPQPQHYVDHTAVDYVTMELMVPENLVGGLIGRFGANISRIRNESGANIKVYGARGEQQQRQIHLDGTAQQVALAKQRVDEYVYAELMRQAGSAPQQPAVGQLQQYATQQPMPTLYQGYGHDHGFYANSNPEDAMVGTFPQMYGSTQTNQAPQYYGHPPYPPPPAPPL